ncbi:ribosomal RNA small subunit methyltransferase A [Candidatus Parcubacteria bacterium]|jgi:16S rRNA (adenine1518-N6/adenine1519-N6)-dimethyltransferase|nr:ribosomal RNA small subunit methyltransferase A [Candidatus Parcubacteria bacterium]MBT7227955.1 ribosomal RNA small subunit methyltransferase A [Candidatus Parcubacteria bacterium]
MTKDELQFLLKKYNLTPNKIRGQNFLVSDEVLDDIIVGSQVNDTDLVIEVGAGLGALTQKLTENAEQVVSLEIDKNLARPLEKIVNLTDNLEIIWQDILSFSEGQVADVLSKYKKSKYKIIANIPYYLTGKFIQKFLTIKYKPSNMTLMVQKEVAERIIVGDGKHSKLSLSVALYAESKIVRIVEKNNFYPAPKIDSAIIQIDNIKNWDYDVEEKKVWQLIKLGFASKRKKLINNLANEKSFDKDKLKKVFEKLDLDETIRAEKITVENWLKLAKNL